jgi:hypothetical protein
MATLRTVLNRVLRTVSETEVDGATTTISDDYHKLVATFINHIKEEIEDAHNWRDLQQSHTATVTANTQAATIVNATDRSRLAYSRSEDGPVPLVFDVTTASNPLPLIEVPLADLEYMIATDYPGTGTQPSYFAILASTDETMQIKVYPKPTTTRTITLIMFTPQARLAEVDLDVAILIPARPLEMGAIWYALEERGEELGESSLFSEERWRKALDDAVARDAEAQGGYELQPV